MATVCRTRWLPAVRSSLHRPLADGLPAGFTDEAALLVASRPGAPGLRPDHRSRPGRRNRPSAGGSSRRRARRLGAVAAGVARQRHCATTSRRAGACCRSGSTRCGAGSPCGRAGAAPERPGAGPTSSASGGGRWSRHAHELITVSRDAWASSPAPPARCPAIAATSSWLPGRPRSPRRRASAGRRRAWPASASAAASWSRSAWRASAPAWPITSTRRS